MIDATHFLRIKNHGYMLLYPHLWSCFIYDDGDGSDGFVIFNLKCINRLFSLFCLPPPDYAFPLNTSDISLLSHLIPLIFFFLLFSISLFFCLSFFFNCYRLMSGTKTMSACLLRWSMARQRKWRHFSPRKVPAL